MKIEKWDSMKPLHIIFAIIVFSLTLSTQNSVGQIKTNNSSLDTDTFIDVFPLTHNLHYQYEYVYKYSYSELAYPVIAYIDSGTVDYIIDDSVRINDTTLVWNVLQRERLWHNGVYNYGGPDTIYYSSKDTKGIITEYLDGSHELKCSLIVWSFPLIYPDLPVYRYADSSSFVIIRNYTPPLGCIRSGVDSLWFNDNLGFYRRIQTYFGACINHYCSSLEVRLMQTPTVDVSENKESVSHFMLQQNYPNPFNPETVIDFIIPKRGNVRLSIYNVLGQELIVLASGVKDAGRNSVRFNAQSFPSGVYFYRLISEDHTETKKMMLVR